MTKMNDLAAAIAEKEGISVRKAENFLSTMVRVMNEALDKDKLLKMKGLGTFKVTSISARESVDVNSGERIVIEGHEKVSFIPDATMRDFVNKPFAQFETVIVNEGVDFEAIDEKFGLISEVTDEKSQLVKKENTDHEAKPVDREAKPVDR